jgi:hypothetical protein
MGKVFEKIGNGLLKIKTIVKNYYSIQIAIFFIIILCVNAWLIKNGHFDNEDPQIEDIRKEGKTAVDSFYFTSTQFSTIGYGDISPKSKRARIISSFFHIIIIALTFKLFAEFGIMSELDKMQKKIAIETIETYKRDGFLTSSAVQKRAIILGNSKLQNTTKLVIQKIKDGKVSPETPISPSS